MKPSWFAAALGLGLANHLLVVMSYIGTWWPHVHLVPLLGPIVVLAVAIVADRRGHQAICWLLLLGVYGTLAFFVQNDRAAALYILSDQTMAHGVAFGVLFADHRMATSRGRLTTYILAGTSGIAIGALILAIVLRAAPELLASNASWVEEQGLPHFVDLYVSYVALHWMLFGGAAVLFYGERRLAEGAVHRLHAAEVERVARVRQVVESRLQLMQARIEPGFLFGTLERVKRLYTREPEAAEDMLNELGAFLRAAMPQMRDSYSNVGREAELVRAYVAIVGIQHEMPIACTIDVPAELAEAPVPSMLLLPLAEQWLAGARAAPGDVAALQIAAAHRSGGLRLVVACSRAPPEAPGRDVFSDIRERLHTLYGEQATLAVGQTGDEIECVLEMPLNFADLPLGPRRR